MATKSDIYRTANLLITEYGEMAPIGANIRADRLRDAGDERGYRVWRRIAIATEDLLAEGRPDDAAVH